jgi:hypothetical protein
MPFFGRDIGVGVEERGLDEKLVGIPCQCNGQPWARADENMISSYW